MLDRIQVFVAIPVVIDGLNVDRDLIGVASWEGGQNQPVCIRESARGATEIDV